MNLIVKHVLYSTNMNNNEINTQNFTTYRLFLKQCHHKRHTFPRLYYIYNYNIIVVTSGYLLYHEPPARDNNKNIHVFLRVYYSK